jgi:hypothetical protein
VAMRESRWPSPRAFLLSSCSRARPSCNSWHLASARSRWPAA